jgi:hypothetical protein
MFTGITHIGGDLIIEDCPYFRTLGFYDWMPADELSSRTCFGNVVSVEGSIRINNALMYNWSFPALETVGGDFEIRFGNGAVHNWGGWYDFNDTNYSMTSLPATIGGDLIITDNPTLQGLGGWEKIQSIGGNVTYTRNDLVLDNLTRLCPIKIMIANGVIKPTATVTLGLGNGEPVDLDEIVCE